MYLVLLGANEGALVDIGMDLDVGVIAKLKSVLGKGISRVDILLGGARQLLTHLL